MTNETLCKVVDLYIDINKSKLLAVTIGTKCHNFLELSFELLGIATDIVNSGNDLCKTISLMCQLRQFIVDSIKPESLSLCMIDYMSDEGMWSWVSNFDANKISTYDFEAQYWALISLKEIIDNEKTLVEINEC